MFGGGHLPGVGHGCNQIQFQSIVESAILGTSRCLYSSHAATAIRSTLEIVSSSLGHLPLHLHQQLLIQLSPVLILIHFLEIVCRRLPMPLRPLNLPVYLRKQRPLPLLLYHHFPLIFLVDKIFDVMECVCSRFVHGVVNETAVPGVLGRRHGGEFGANWLCFHCDFMHILSIEGIPIN